MSHPPFQCGPQSTHPGPLMHADAYPQGPLTQTPTGADILTVGHPDVDTLTTSVVAALRRCGVPDPTVDIRDVDRNPRNQASGKLKRFIAL